MKKILAAFCTLILTACIATEPTYQNAENSEFTKANHAATDKLVAATSIPIDRNLPLLVATVVNIDSLTQSSRFGRLVSEQVSARLTQLGFNVTEMKLRNNVYIREGSGELLLSRDVRDLTKAYNAQVVIVGNYAVASGYVFLTLKAVNAADNQVIGAVNYQLPINGNTKALINLPKQN